MEAKIVPLDGTGFDPPGRWSSPYDDIPDPTTGQRRRWIRVTSWAKTCADLWAVHNWEKRTMARGFAQREDLLLRVAAVQDPDSKKGKAELDRLCDQAKEAARGDAGGNLGTALHSLTETLDHGKKLGRIPPPFDRDIDAYRQRKQEIGVEVSANYIERVCLLPELGVAGTLDRLVRFNAGEPLIGDLKTTQNIDYSWQEIAIQLAIYAHATHVWDRDKQQHFPMPRVNQKVALVLWLPAGQGVCTPYWLDIEAGWEAAMTCGWVRKWRNRKDLATPLVKEGA